MKNTFFLQEIKSWCNFILYLIRCLYLSVVLHAPLAADRPDVQESPTAALIVCPVQMERSATRLVAPYMFCSFIYFLTSVRSRRPLKSCSMWVCVCADSLCPLRFYGVQKMSWVLLVRQRQGEMCGRDWRIPVFLRHHGHHPGDTHTAEHRPDSRHHYHLSPFSFHTNRQGQQLRNKFLATPVTQALLPVFLGVHWPAICVDMSTPPGSIRDQFCPLSVLPPCEDHCGSLGFPG